MKQGLMAFIGSAQGIALVHVAHSERQWEGCATTFAQRSRKQSVSAGGPTAASAPAVRWHTWLEVQQAQAHAEHGAFVVVVDQAVAIAAEQLHMQAQIAFAAVPAFAQGAQPFDAARSFALAQ